MTTDINKVTNPHYYQDLPGGYGNIDLASELSFNLGNAEKYIFRSCKLNHNNIKGEPIVDLNKALWYLNRELKNCQEVLENRSLFKKVMLSVVRSNPISRKVMMNLSQYSYRSRKDSQKLEDVRLVVSTVLTHNGKLAIREIVKADSNFTVTNDTVRHIRNAIGFVSTQIELYTEHNERYGYKNDSSQ